jgi:hypothetical protein
LEKNVDRYRQHPQVILAKELARAAGLDPNARIGDENSWPRPKAQYVSFMDAAFEEHFAHVAVDNIFWDHGGSSYTDRWRIPDRDGDCLFWYGRCKSGRRWFWIVRGRVKGRRIGEDAFADRGYAISEAEALTAGTIAIKRFAAGRRAIVNFQHGSASYELKKINEAKRTARWAAAPADGSDTRAAEFLFDQWGDEFRITKQTAQRVYYVKASYDFDGPRIGFVARHRVADDWPGPTWWELYDLQNRVGWRNAPKFFLKPRPAGFNDRGKPPPVDLAQLKAEMAAAHPDKGGSSAAFIEARQRYVAARRRALEEKRK